MMSLPTKIRANVRKLLNPGNQLATEKASVHVVVVEVDGAVEATTKGMTVVESAVVDVVAGAAVVEVAGAAETTAAAGGTTDVAVAAVIDLAEFGSVAPSTEVVEGTIEGVLELHPKQYGFLRDPKKNYIAQESDPFVPSSLVEKARLREGVLIKGEVGPGVRDQGPRLHEIETIDGLTIEEYANVGHFEDLIPVTPDKKISLETGPRPVTMAGHGFADAGRHGPAGFDRGSAENRKKRCSFRTSRMPSRRIIRKFT